jgi:hypothetical protein
VASGRGEVVALVELIGDAYVGGDVVACVLEVRLVRQVRYVLGGAGSQGVHTEYVVAFREELLAEVAPQESGSPRNQC